MAVANLQTEVAIPRRLAKTMNRSAEPAARTTLAEGEVKQLVGDHRWALILCLVGSVWITQERDLADYILNPEQAFLVTQPGRVVIQARQATVIEITLSLRNAPYTGRLFGQAFP